jgi:hypothetical protein
MPLVVPEQMPGDLKIQQMPEPERNSVESGVHEHAECDGMGLESGDLKLSWEADDRLLVVCFWMKSFVTKTASTLSISLTEDILLHHLVHHPSWCPLAPSSPCRITHGASNVIDRGTSFSWWTTQHLKLESTFPRERETPRFFLKRMQ